MRSIPRNCPVSRIYYGISKKGIELSKNKVERIRHWQAPTSLSELRNFVGFINFYQTHLKDFARLCQPFYRLFRKNVLFNWTPECQKNFDKLKDMVSKAPVLGVPKLDKGPFVLTTDGSKSGLGAVLTQIQDDQEVTISFWSKTLNDAQRNYCITHLQLLAVVEAVDAHDLYLAGAPFIIRTDHSALQFSHSRN